MNFQTRLLGLREERNMKQSDLAGLLNFKPSVISKYEKGLIQPSMATLKKMAEIFECSVDYLIGISSVKNPYSPGNFTPGEVEIIMKFRRLSPENRIRIDERIGAMLDGQR